MNRHSFGWLLLSALLIGAVAVLVAGCGDGKKSSATTTAATTAARASISAPANIKSAGKIVYCSDIAYPPEEYYKGSTPIGSDIDIGTEIARLMGVKAQFNNTGFDGIIAALQSKKCDLIISGMNDTTKRRKQVAFVDYINVGQSFMIGKGNPKHITNIASLSGKVASVEAGTTNKGFLHAQIKKLTAAGKKLFKIVTFPKDTDAANALKAGKVDAYFAESPVVAYYAALDPSSFQLARNPEVVNPIPVGIAVRKSNADLRDAVQAAINSVYGDGTMTRILAKWKMSAAAMNK